MLKGNKILSVFTSLVMFIFILNFSIIVCLNFRNLYYFDIKHLDITKNINMNYDEIKHNYDVLINYMVDTKKEKLILPSFSVSKEAEIHFEEVKNIFENVSTYMYFSAGLSLILILINYKTKNTSFLLGTTIVTLIIPLLFIVIVGLNFNWLFNTFHKFMFKNDYWLFDPAVDQVIKILPQGFFMHELILILLILFLFSFVSFILYKIL